MDQIEEEVFKATDKESFSNYEMSQLGIFSNESLEIYVYGNDGSIPHFHFINESKEIEGCIRLDKPEYFHHSENESTLNLEQKKALIKFFNSPSKDIPVITNWQAIIVLWNANNRKNQISNNTSMPDYSILK